MPGLTFDEIPSTVGTVVEGVPFILTQEELKAFETATWLDRAYVEELPEFPETLVEGFWLLGMLDASIKMAAHYDTTSVWGLNYGLDRVRFVSPVYVGERVLSTYETIAVEPKDGGYKILRRCTFTVEGRTRPAMTADWWTLALPRGKFDVLMGSAGE